MAARPETDLVKYTVLDAAPDSAHSLVLGLVPPGSRVLEFGCATGYVSAELTERLGCTVTGVEISEAAADEARRHCERVIVGDAEQLDLPALVGEERFDVILFADVLEHLRAPAAVLARVRGLLTDDGAIVASIPNVAHGSVRVALLGGEWRYRPLGLLDDSHLRFFTRDGVQELFETQGYAITHWLRRHQPIEDTEMGVRVPPALEPHLAGHPEVTTYQFIVRAVATEPARLVGELRRELVAAHERSTYLETVQAELRAVLAPLQTVAAEVEQHREHLGALAKDLATATAHQTELRALLRDAHTRLLERDGEMYALQAKLGDAQWEATNVKSTRVWRLAERYWRIRDLLRRKGPR